MESEGGQDRVDSESTLLLRRGIQAAKAGQRERARALLMRVVELDEESVSAWMWLSEVVDGLGDKAICLENVLTLDPDNQAALRGLEWVRSAQSSSPAVVEESPSEPEPAAEAALSLPAPPLQAPPFSASAAPEVDDLWTDPPSPYLCPYCASPTLEEDPKCPVCMKDLWIDVRRRETRSLALWMVVFAQFWLVLFYLLAPLAVITVVSYLVGVNDPFPLVPAYLGLSTDLPPEIVQRALGLVPQIYLAPLWVGALYSLFMLVGTYLRWKPIFYLLLVGVALRLAVSIVGIAVGKYYGAMCGGSGVLVTVASFFLTLQLEDDFFTDVQRVYFGIGRRFKSGVSLLQQGRAYTKQKMWALAVLYLRAGVARAPEQLAGHTSLILAYMHLERFDLAKKAVETAQHFFPDHPRIVELADLIDQKM